MTPIGNAGDAEAGSTDPPGRGPVGRCAFERRSFLAGAGSAFLAPAAIAAEPARASARASDPLWFVDPELRPVAVTAQEIFASIIPVSDRNLLHAREASARISAQKRPDIAWKKHSVGAGSQQPDVIVYAINAKPGERRPAILHIHGGGFVLGTAFSAVPRLQEMAAALDCVIVTVEYRLAPEVDGTAMIEDNYAGLRWLHDEADLLGVDRSRLAVMGESAGGGLAAMLAILARDRGDVPLIFQCLSAPMLDDRTGLSRLPPPHIGTLVWDTASNRFGWRSFLGAPADERPRALRHIPARVGDLAGLPPAWIGVGAIDLFVQEDMDYARRLVDAAVPTQLLVVPGAFHGFQYFGAAAAPGKIFLASQMEALRRALTAQPA